MLSKIKKDKKYWEKQEQNKKEQIEVLKTIISNACVFCNELPADREPFKHKTLLHGLPICGICEGKWRLLRGEKIDVEIKDFLYRWFHFRCYFCEADITSADDGSFRGTAPINDWPLLCGSSCITRYEVLMEWTEIQNNIEKS